MKHVIAILVVFLMAASPVLGDTTSAPNGRDREHGRNAPTAQHPLEVWGRERFAVAGLELPAVRFTVHHSADACGGHSGLTRTGGAVVLVDICVPGDAPELALRRVVLHELAHVWADANLDAADQDAFVRLRGAVAWNGVGTWEHQASEQAADILAWGLIDRPLRIVVAGPSERADLVAAFVVLTGREPISPNA